MLGFVGGVPSVCKLVFFHEQHDMEDCSALSLAYLVVNLCRKLC
ncbi:putative lipoprotein [Anaplasma phagocytophilum str. CRT53-1]|uniref:Putative lipoprotein n=1 Tax=Anaplasma phagocytophilum str. CRT53-1 TaxID=1359157 RepID=A0A0F3Q498_ANAPH|nr:putative lipoprotein [Anaplasma phagocytophilum str. CRT53-1]